MMRKIIKWCVIGFGLLAIGAALGSSGDDSTSGTKIAPAKTTDTAQVSETPEPEETPPPRVREEPNPDGRYELNCDYTLPDDIDSEDYRFIAGGTIENTGNVGIVVRVTYKWDLLGQAPFKEQKTYRLRTGRERDVNVSYPVTSDMIDAHQSADGDCKTTVSIVDAFGKPPFE